MKPYVVSTILATIYFIIGIITLSDYGISWDETIHFYRGQSYLHYFLTGEKSYQGLPDINLQGTDGDPKKIFPQRRSFYQNDDYNGEYFFKNDSGHPPLNGEMAALSNYVFYQKLGILGDVESHHLFNVLASCLLVFVVVFFAYETTGLLGGLIAGLLLITYPMFWAESHFNIKDIPEAAFFAATIWTFYKSTKSFRKKWLACSFLFFALALGTKFNAFFIPVIILSFLILQNKLNFPKMYQKFKSIPRSYLTLLIIGPFLSFVIFYGTWPFLWQSFPENLLKIFIYYKEIGTNARYQPDSFFVYGFNLFPLLWIIFTTPPILLVLSAVGLVISFIKYSELKGIGLLYSLWFLTPIIRASLPGVVIYGGDRQIMEFLPAMVLLSGIGAWYIIKRVKVYFADYTVTITVLTLLLIFLWQAYIIMKMHPNQNVYFNSLIGGLKGAEEKKFPSWGNSFGNAYFQGIKWINQNAEYGSKLALIQGTATNVPAIFVRSDIDYKSSNWSGIERQGEYLMELTFNDSARDFHYAWDYVNNFLTPVYELKVDEVVILKIWKNDLEHTKDLSKKGEVELPGLIEVKKEDRQIVFDLGKIEVLSRVYLYFDPVLNCSMPKVAFVELSKDKSIWTMEKDLIPFSQVKQENNMTKNSIEYWIAGKEARYIKFIFENKEVCPLNYQSVKVLLLN